jgi:hypothetical protein
MNIAFEFQLINEMKHFVTKYPKFARVQTRAKSTLNSLN